MLSFKDADQTIAAVTNTKTKLAEATLKYNNLSTNNSSYTGHYPPTINTQGYPPPIKDFVWDESSDEPHATRRKLILQAHPEISKLYGHCTKTKYIVLALVATQFALAYYLKNKMWTLEYWVIAYVLGATITHSLFLAIHEISHFLAFKSPNANRYLAMFANLPIGIPYCVAFRGYHMDHHTLQGVDGIDTDLPTELEAQLFSSTPGKLFFCTFQILFYALRPMLVKAQVLTKWHALNWIIQSLSMALMIYYHGPNPFFYFLTSTILSGSLHPMAGHFIAEHYVFVKGFETFSYYGPLNKFINLTRLAFNVGFHNEHHDFPRVPGSRLPLVNRIANEFYCGLPVVTSWSMTLFNFIFFNHITPYSRVKRHQKLN